MRHNELFSQFFAEPYLDPAAPQASGLRQPEDWFFDAVGGGGRSDSGVTVTPTSAMTHVPVWQAVNILAGDLGQLPWHKMKRTDVDGDNTKTGKDREHPLEFLLTKHPNAWQTPSLWKETMMQWALLWGNGISWIRRVGNEKVLWPLHPSVTSFEQMSPGEFIITTRIDNKLVPIAYRDVFHIRGLASDGFWGISAIQTMKNAIGHGLALQKHGNEVFKNAAMPAGAVTFPDTVGASPEAAANFRAEFKKVHKEAGEVVVLWDGGTYTPISMSNVDAEWLEGRKLDRQFIASIFNLPAFKLNGAESSSTRSNMEEQNRSYYQTSLSRWTNRFSEEAERKLLRDDELRSGEHFFRWFPEAFLRGDLKSRSEAYGFAIRDRWMNPNEVRAKEDMNSYEGGDEFLNPAIDTVDGDGGDNNAESMSEDGIKNLLRVQVSSLLDIESTRVVAAHKKYDDFAGWIDSFYTGEPFHDLVIQLILPAATLGQDIGLCAAWGNKTISHALASRATLKRIIDGVAPGPGQQAAVQEFADANRANVDILLKQIMEQDNGKA